MQRIFKYTLTAPDSTLPLADTDTILRVGTQNDAIVVWAVRDEAIPVDGRRVVCVNTGSEPPFGYRYVDTVTISNGIVWHVFQRRRVEGA